MKGFFCAIAAALAVSTTAAAATTADGDRGGGVRRRLANVPCNVAAGCVLASFEFSQSVLECASCTPADSKWRCPTGDRNYLTAAMKATFGPAGFGAWSTSQCVRKTYSKYALNGPAAYDDHFVPACPKAEVCLCGDAAAKVKQHFPPNANNAGLTDRERSGTYWASAAPGFTLVQGFTDVSGHSGEHFDLVYTHADGRRQFCSSMVQSMTYSPQQGGPHTYARSGYTTGCAYSWASSCDEGYVDAGTSSCKAGGWYPWGSKRRCVPATPNRQPFAETARPAGPQQAATTAPAWGAWSACDKKCGGGKKQRFCYHGTGAKVNQRQCDGGQRSQNQACNTNACATTTSSCAYWPSCPSGFSAKSSSWCGSWWETGKRRFTCTQSA